MKPSPVTRLNEALEKGSAPPFDWTIEYAADGTCDAAWRAEIEADHPQSFLMVMVWVHVGTREQALHAFGTWLKAARMYRDDPRHYTRFWNAPTRRERVDAGDALMRDEIAGYWNYVLDRGDSPEGCEAMILRELVPRVRAPTMAEVLSALANPEGGHA